MDQGLFRKLGWKRGGLIACGAFCVVVFIGWWLASFLAQRHWKIEWEAWATLAAGLMAVGAAVFVGLKQADIQAKQVDLEERQTNIELLDRRAEAIKTLSDFVRNHLSPHTPVSEREWARIYDTLNQARLVYPTEISDLFLRARLRMG